MNDFDAVEKAIDLIETAEVMAVFNESVWLKVDRELFEQVRFTIDGSEDAGLTDQARDLANHVFGMKGE